MEAAIFGYLIFSRNIKFFTRKKNMPAPKADFLIQHLPEVPEYSSSVLRSILFVGKLPDYSSQNSRLGHRWARDREEIQVYSDRSTVPGELYN